jgi:basic membrane lipoprotein Med (substrate-binding protein (PBP1-ABC) superfamily)
MQNIKNKPLEAILIQLKSVKLTTHNIIEILHNIMEIVENLDKTLNGADKKQLALDAIKYILNHQDLSENDKILLGSIIDQVAPHTIDIIINVSNGVSNLVKTSSCCSFFKS